MPRPLPQSAVSIYSADGLLWVQFPTAKGNTAEVSFQPTPNGMAALQRFLREREIAMAGRAPHYATPAAPIQHIVDTWQSSPSAPEKLQKAKASADADRFKSKSKKEQINELADLFSDPNFEF